MLYKLNALSISILSFLVRLIKNMLNKMNGYVGVNIL